MLCLKNGESIAKVILFQVCKDGFKRKTRRKSSIFTSKVLDGRRSDVVLEVAVILCSTELGKFCGEAL